MKDDRLYLIHIRETLARVKKFTAGGKAEFLGSELIQDATIRNLQILTESTQRLSDEFKQQHSEIDWTGMAGFRNVLTHGYLSIDLARVWEVVERHLPILEQQLEEVFSTLPMPPEPGPKERTKKSSTKPKPKKRKP